MKSVVPLDKKELDYRAEDDFRTLQRAEEVRGDGDRHGRAMKHGRKQQRAIDRVMKSASPVSSSIGRQSTRMRSQVKSIQRKQSRVQSRSGGR